MTLTSVRSAPNVLLTVMTYGIRSPRLTFSIGVDFVTDTAPSSLGSSGMWLLKSALVPGSPVSSSVRNEW